MSASTGSRGKDSPRPMKVLLPPETADRLRQFCRDHLVTEDEVVTRALEEYFREGDMSH